MTKKPQTSKMIKLHFEIAKMNKIPLKPQMTKNAHETSKLSKIPKIL